MIEQFKQMPKGMQILMVATTVVSLIGVAAMIDRSAIIIVLLGLILVALAVFAWHLFIKWKARKQAKALRGQLSASSSSSLSSISAPARRAKLDDLRQNFSKGMDKFRAAGKDIYSLPWYVVCGEPGSGKSEAIRHCNVGFPPGLQNEMQGVGGTLNMHWWFTNQAVLLDTAGKLLFEEAPPGSTTEWSEFLSLLKKARPNCPVNGLLLVIPSESLIRDSFEDIKRKAGKIAQQLDVIQKNLDVRFPVFILITKCDLINGFREFFSGIKDPQLQNQMTGWSNADPLDSPFRPEAVDQHLEQVVQRISRRRLGLLKDPVPADAGARRMDEVDALFALPSSIAGLAPRLRKYLETIFVASEWSSKPLFLRGIYFTSALTEGAALDSELAAALGISAEKLPEGKAWEREHSYFLRDLFLQKIFKEQGLVTRANNTKRLMRIRQWLIGGVAVAGMAILVILSLIGRSALRRSVGGELVFWRVGAQDSEWSGNHWHPIVDKDLNYIGSDIVRLDYGREWPIVEFHTKLKERVSTDLDIPWVFKPIESIAVRANPNRRRAQKVLFEASVIMPLLDATRESLLNASAWTPADASRLASLIELEGAIYLKSQPGFVPGFSGEEFLAALLGPSLGSLPKQEVVMEGLSDVFDWTYFRGGAAHGQWPALSLSGGRTLRDNAPIAKGVELLDKSVANSQLAQTDAFKAIRSGRLTAIRFLDAEAKFLAAASVPRVGNEWLANVESAWRVLATRRVEMDTLMDDLQRRVGGKGEVSLDAAFRATLEHMSNDVGRASRLIRTALLKQKVASDAAATVTSGPITEFRLYRDLQNRLMKLDSQIAMLVEQVLPQTEQAQLADYDAQALKPTAANQAAYVHRCDVYAFAMQSLGIESGGESLLGRLGPAVGQAITAMKSAREKAAKYDGAFKSQFLTAQRNLLDAASSIGAQRLFESYCHELDAAVADTTEYPFGSGRALTADEFKVRHDALLRVRTDAADASVPPETKRTLEERFARANRLAGYATSLAGANGMAQIVKLFVARDKDQAPIIERIAGTSASTRVLVGRVFPSMRMAGRDFRVRGLMENAELGRFGLADKLPAIEFSTTPDPKATPDAKIELGESWSLLRLLSQGSIRRAEGQEWDAVIRIKDGKSEVMLAVTIVLEKPLPPVSEWPAREN